jgi:sensor histidine kinase YesM
MQRPIIDMFNKAASILPGTLVILTSVIIALDDYESTNLRTYLSEVFSFTLELGPMIIGLAVVDTLSISRRGVYRVIILIVGTLALIGISEFTITEPFIKSNGVNFIMLWSFYSLHYISEWIKVGYRANFKVTMSLDKALMFLVIFVSFISALIINSHPGGVYNQPIPIAIDLVYNFQHLFGLLSYWGQLFLTYMCLYVIYYLNHHVLIEYFLGEKGIIVYLMSGLVLLLLLYPLLSYFVLSLPISDSPYPFIPSQNRNIFAIENFNTGLSVLAVSLPLVLAFKWQEKSRLVSELEKGQLQAELALLQQQINPHFLFNSLNSLYALTLTRSEKAPEAVLQLSSLFRYVVYRGNKARVPLSDEFSYLSDYLALQRLRMGEKCEFDCTFDKVSSTLEIAPLMLIVFLENAFKHGLETNNQESWLRVHAKVNDRLLSFKCENSILRNRDAHEPGIGLDNVRKRLKLQYEDRHFLKIETKEDRFSVTLTIEL